MTGRARNERRSDGPHFGVLLVPDLPGQHSFGVRELPALARAAEQLGLHRVAVDDHLLHVVPAYDPVACLAAIAVTTQRIRIAVEVMVLPLRHPVRVAQAITTLDHLSGGRVELGVGVGGEWPVEYAALGVDVRTRGNRADEALEALTALWGPSPASFHGRHYDFADVALRPSPLQLPHPPIAVGGRSRAALRRAARFADRWDGIFLDPGQYQERAGALQGLAAQTGRQVGMGLVAWLAAGPRRSARAALAATLEPFYQTPLQRIERFLIYGPPPALRQRVSELIAVGAREVTLIPVGDPLEQLAAIAELAASLAVTP
ncbi:MAG: TIGR03619 family F420-dependent LLM class oxidoreductase [Candidatus Dormibacteria bacterium]